MATIYDEVFIYKLSCKDTSILPFYIGSTIDLYQRMASHKNSCKTNKKRYLYEFINDYGGFQNWKYDILLHEKNKTLKQKTLLEKEFMDMYKPQLNKTVIGRTRKQYNDDHRQQINLYNRMGHYRNLEQRRKYLRDRYHEKKEKYLPIIRKTMNANKEKYKAHRQFRVNCLCGCNHTWQNRHKHRKTKEHQENMIKIKKEIIDICLKLKPITENKQSESG